MEKPCKLSLTLEEFFEKIDHSDFFGTYVVSMWYKQGEGWDPEEFNIIIEYDLELRSWVWSWDWDEGGDAFILGYQELDDIDVAGQGIGE